MRARHSAVSEPIRVMLAVAQTLEGLDVPYFVGGSVGTAMHGMARATMNVDLAVGLRGDLVRSSAEALQEAFYLDERTIRKAVRQQRSLNLIHLDSGLKVDLFVHNNRPFDHSQFARRMRHFVDTGAHESVYVASPEDNILAKLLWYRQGGEVSDRQWHDVLSVMRIQSESLDLAYLTDWSRELGVEDLMVSAWEEATCV